MDKTGILKLHRCKKYEYDKLTDSLTNYQKKSLISRYILVGKIDNYEVRLVKGYKTDILSSKWKIYLSEQ